MTLTQEEAKALYRQAADKKNDNCDYGGCLKDATGALGAFLELKNKEWEGKCYTLIGLAHKKLGNYKQAIEYLQKYLQIARELGDVPGEQRALQNIQKAKSHGTRSPARTRSARQSATDRVTFASTHGNLDMLKQSLEDPNLALDQQETKAIHLAAQHGQLEIVQYLVSQQADVNAENATFLTAVDIATIHGHPLVAAYLTETCGAIIIRSGAVMKLLRGARLSPPAFTNTTLCMAWNGGGTLLDSVEQDNYRRTPVHLASYRGKHEWLKRAFQKTDSGMFRLTDSRGWNPLHYAVQNPENADTVVLLMEFSPGYALQRDRDGLLPYDVAASELKRLLPKGSACFWTAQGLSFAVMTALTGWVVPPVVLLASVLSEPFSAALSKSPRKVGEFKWLAAGTVAYATVAGLVVCVVHGGAPWALPGLAGCLSVYMLWAMSRSFNDVSMNLVKHPRPTLERSPATAIGVVAMVYRFFVLSGSVTKIAVGELPQGSVLSLSAVVPDVAQWPLAVALLKFQVKFAFELSVFPLFALIACWYLVASWTFYSVVAVEREGFKRRFAFVTEDFFDKIPFGSLVTDLTTGAFFLTIYQKLLEMLVCSPGSAPTMAANHDVPCWGPTHRMYASIALGALLFLVPTATIIGTSFMESKSDTETVFLCWKSTSSSVRWTQSFQVWQIGTDMAIGAATVALPESSAVRLAIVVLCNVALAAFIHFKSPCQHLWAVNHWAKASHMGVTILSIYTFLNGQGWLANDLVRFSWGFAWLGIVLLFLIGHLCHRRKVPVHPETIA